MTTSSELVDLGKSVLKSNRALALRGGQQVTLAASVACSKESKPHPDYGPIVGVVCSSDIAAVGYPLKASLNSERSSRSSLIAVVVPRVGRSLVIAEDHHGRLDPINDEAPIIDIGRRALGVATPPPDRDLLHLLDRIWVDRMMTAVLEADLGSGAPWAMLASLHPVHESTCPTTQLADSRSKFMVGWSELHNRVANASIRWPSMTPSVAGWLDEGSFARWCLADTPEPRPLLADLDDLLDPWVSCRIRESLAPLGSTKPVGVLSGDPGQQ